MTHDTIIKAKEIEIWLKPHIKNISRNPFFWGHCKKHLFQEDSELIRMAMNPVNKYGGSCFYIKDKKELFQWLLEQMLSEPIFSEIAIWLAEGSNSNVFYIESDDYIGKIFKKRGHDWSTGAIQCDQAILYLEKVSDTQYDFIVKTAYPIP